MATNGRVTSSKWLGAPPSDVRRIVPHEREYKGLQTTDPVLDTINSSRKEQPGTRTHSSELLETVEVRRWGDCRERRNNSCALHSGGAPDQHHALLVHINRDNVVQAEATATLVREWLADALSGAIPTTGTIKEAHSSRTLEDGEIYI
jgi:hypothetical protein